MKLIYHRNKCIGCVACLQISSDFWSINSDDGKADLLDSEISKGIFVRKIWDKEIQMAKEFEKNCPTKAIKFNK